ncbi:hypothetical protein [Massilia sp. CF038]|uniref:hypothetical protein n=1 Tax=Massilia sp. CF038 TaxID=1881045 RepID=UPI000922B5C6|nr:hypothetical protein [Massilia sp. CF038]SHG56697.1 hypothetical protein SAMN05428948_1060 [Massilia sp. CF038]
MLLRNDLLHYTFPRERTVRILWIDAAHKIAYTFELHAKSAHPQIATLGSLVEDVNSGRAQLLLVDPYLVQARPDDLPVSHLQLQARAWDVVSTLVTQEPAIYQPSARGGMVLRHAELHGISYPSVYRYLRRYWERGQNANALLPDYKNSGGRGKTRSSRPDVKRGRPRKGEGHPGMNASNDVRETFRDAVARYAATHRAFSRRGAYRQMIEDFFSTGDTAATPSFGQFNYWIEKDACLVPRHAAPRQPQRIREQPQAAMGA